jgi:hypothetical protein
VQKSKESLMPAIWCGDAAAKRVQNDCQLANTAFAGMPAPEEVKSIGDRRRPYGQSCFDFR